jgi:hypothetical protein
MRPKDGRISKATLVLPLHHAAQQKPVNRPVFATSSVGAKSMALCLFSTGPCLKKLKHKFKCA